MAETNETILFVFEGEKTEPQITHNLQTLNLLGKARIEALYGADIHQLYKILKIDDDLDVVGYFLENQVNPIHDRKKLGKLKESIAQIFLFFDLDPHSNNYSNQHLLDLLNFFNNETDKGKLLISYPMVECVKYLANNLEEFCSLTYPINMGTSYKQYINQQTYKSDFNDFRRYQLSSWYQLVEYHCTKANFLVNGIQCFPEKNIAQTSIYQSQFEKYINTQASCVLTLSAFPLFLLDFYGAATIRKRLNPYY